MKNSFASSVITGFFVFLMSLVTIATPSMALEENEAHQNVGSRDKFLPEKLTSTSSDRINLTSEEQEFIKKHPVIRVSNEMDYRPFDFARDGKPKGYSIDYLNLLAVRLGIRLEYVNGYSWNDLLSMFERRDLDLIHSAMETEERLRYTVFTRPYVTLMHALVTRKDNNNIKTLADLKGKTLAMMKGWATNEFILPRYPDIQILWVGDTLEGLKAVAAGQADAVIDAQSVVSYLIKKYFLDNTHFVCTVAKPDRDLVATEINEEIEVLDKFRSKYYLLFHKRMLRSRSQMY